MSTLKVNTVQHNTTGFNNVVQFTDGAGTENGTLCRAWVNFDGTFATSPFTIANGGIRDSFNVSSITDNGTGNYTVNFTNSMPDTDYSVIGSGWYTVSGFSGPAPICAYSYATSSVTVIQWYMTATTNQGPTNGLYNNIAIFS
jgi:hypothetical protein